VKQLAIGVLTHCPVPGLQLDVEHADDEVQVTGFDPTHTPA
jgi:hypothetical protein